MYSSFSADNELLNEPLVRAIGVNTAQKGPLNVMFPTEALN